LSGFGMSTPCSSFKSKEGSEVRRAELSPDEGAPAGRNDERSCDTGEYVVVPERIC
jgi:hypothetical protein